MRYLKFLGQVGRAFIGGGPLPYVDNPGTYLFPPLHRRYERDVCVVRGHIRLVVEQHDVDVIGQLWHCGQDKGDSRNDHD